MSRGTGEFAVGAVWRHKRDCRCEVTITGHSRDRIHVKRNTSNRLEEVRARSAQPILITTLLRNYKFDHWLALGTLEARASADRHADRLNELHRGELE